MADDDQGAGETAAEEGTGTTESADELFARLTSEHGGEEDGLEYTASDDDGGDEADAEDVDVEEQKTEAPKAETVEEPERRGPKDRVVQRLTKAESRIIALESENRELRARPQPTAELPDDYVDAIRLVAARRLGVEANDPKVNSEFERAARMVMAEMAGDVDDPDIREVRREREERRKGREIQSQIDELKREREEYKNQALRGQQLQAISAELKVAAPETEFPHTHAAEGTDLPARILEGVQQMVRGGYNITNDEEARDALLYVMERLEGYHREVYERMTAAVGSRTSATSGKQPVDRPTQRIETKQTEAHQDGAEHRTEDKNGRRGRTAPRTLSNTGLNGGRAAPSTGRAETPDEIWERMVREHDSEARRSNAKKVRRD